MVLNACAAAATSEGPPVDSGGVDSPRPKRSEACASARRERVCVRTAKTATAATASEETRKETKVASFQPPGVSTPVRVVSQRPSASGSVIDTVVSGSKPSPGPTSAWPSASPLPSPRGLAKRFESVQAEERGALDSIAACGAPTRRPCSIGVIIRARFASASDIARAGGGSLASEAQDWPEPKAAARVAPSAAG